MNHQRLGYAASIHRLKELGLLQADDHPPISDHLPQPEDEEPLGLSFFRTFVGEGTDLGNLSLPRTFFGRSEISDASFRNTDLSESNLRWNDFIDVDFTDASLSGADLRASIYIRVDFTRTNLSSSDLRRADFQDCIFQDALMDGAMLTHEQGASLLLSDLQKSAVHWTDDNGPEPSGG